MFIAQEDAVMQATCSRTGSVLVKVHMPLGEIYVI